MLKSILFILVNLIVLSEGLPHTPGGGGAGAMCSALHSRRKAGGGVGAVSCAPHSGRKAGGGAGAVCCALHSCRKECPTAQAGVGPVLCAVDYSPGGGGASAVAFSTGRGRAGVVCSVLHSCRKAGVGPVLCAVPYTPGPTADETLMGSCIIDHC